MHHGQSVASRPAITADIRARFRELQRQVNQALHARLATLAPGPLTTAMRDAIVDGKRLRPIVCLAAHEWAGGAVTQAIPAACAIELIHKMTLVHDDVPAMDDAQTRYARPSLHLAHGEAMAILAGHALLIEAFDVLASIQNIPAARVVAAIGHVSRAVGARGVAGGQALDILIQQEHIEPISLTEVHERKSGGLFEAAAAVGAELGGASREQVRAVAHCARQLGVAFQISDDLLDVDDAPGTNYASAAGWTEAERLMRSLLDRAVASLTAASDGDVSLFTALADLIVQRCMSAAPTTTESQDKNSRR